MFLSNCQNHQVLLNLLDVALASSVIDYLHVFPSILLCGVGAAAFASLLGISVDLAFIAGFRGQRIIVHLASLSSCGAAAAEAQACDTVPETKHDAINRLEASMGACVLLTQMVECLTLVLHGSTRADIHTGSRRLCWSSRTCRGSGWWSTR